MTENIIKLNIDTNQIDDVILNQPLVKGQHNFYEFEFHFYKNNELFYDENLLFYVVFERNDREKTNKILLTRKNNIYYKKINEWISDIIGELKISVQILDELGDEVEAFPLVVVNVADGLKPSGTTLDEMHYDSILQGISDVNNLLEEHKLDADNPHLTTPHKIGTYTDLEIDGKDANILSQAKEYADILQIEHDLSVYVPKTRKIAGFELSSDITEADIRTALLVATKNSKGLMSANDKSKLESLWELLDNKDVEFVDTINEILEVFNDYPEALNLFEELGKKVNANEKITGNTKPKITYDSKGLVVSGENLVESDIPDLPTSKITSGRFDKERQDADTIYEGDSRLSDSRTPKAHTHEIEDIEGLEEALENVEVDLSDYAKKNELPTKVGELENDKGYLTQHQDISGLVPKTRKIAGVELSSDISQATLTNALRVATDSLSGIMSADDHVKLTSLYAIFDSGSENYVDTLREILEIFEDYPESTNLITLIGTKVDKTTTVNGKALSGNITLNATDVGARGSTWTPTYAEISGTKPPTNAQKNSDITKAEIEAKLTGSINTHSHSYNDLTNKPTIPTKTSQLTNDSGFATETYVNNKVASVYKYKGSVATFANLPTTNRNVGDVYDVKDTGMNYAWNGTEWDALGTTVDLSNYATKTELTSGLSGKVDKVDGKQLSTNDFTTALLTKLNGIAVNAQVNVLEGVQLNGTDVAISSKKSNIVVNKTTVGLGNVANVDTTNPANITQSSTYRFVTDTEKSTWNGKQNALGFIPENITNKVTTITASSTNTQYPSAKAVYDAINNAIIAGINGGY